jgi:penicillin-insensitive murein DD-endopeptidase
LGGKVKSFLLCAAACVLVTAFCGAASAEDAAAFDQQEAKKAFGAVKESLAQAPQAIGRYERGCVAGAQKIAASGPGWQAMRPSRNRLWGHPILIAYIQRLASDVRRLDGLPGILVGDMAQPIGGPLLGGHASHQMGLDVDLWYTLMPARTLSADEREHIAADNMVNQAALTTDTKMWTEAQVRLLRRAASYTEVARIFVHPAVKKALCDIAGNDRSWLQKIRPWSNHDDHFHVRLNCPPGSPACVAQPAVAAEDGCGQELDDWFKKLRAPRPRGPRKLVAPAKPMLVSDLPKECQELLLAVENAGKPESSAWTPN